MNYDEFSDVLKLVRDAQGNQRDMRTAVREAHHFVDKRDGQWEPDIISRMRGKPRYTDDRTNPIVNQIAGELESAEFTIKIRPAGGNATKPLAQLRDGLIRNIRNLSDADSIFSQAGRKLVKGGFAAWLITHDFYDTDSFDQDLLIEPIHDAHDRVWLDSNDLSDDGSDADWGVVLHYIGKDQYQEMFPDGKMKSLGNDQWNQAYYYKPDFITIAHFYYIKKEKSQLWLMNDGRVLEGTEDNEVLLDELEAQGITKEDTRDVEQRKCYFRMMDAAGWLSDEEETVFDSIPIIPVYGNFEIAEGKILYRGVIEKLMDQQRVHNYAFSRNVEEVALSPRQKIFMTPEQAKGHERSIASMNTNMDPVQFYNNDGESPAPYMNGTANVNPAVQTLVEQSDQAINRSAGLFAANMGDNPNVQSGVALDKIIDRGNNGTSVYFEAMSTAIRRTGRILNKAIPIVYDATRQARILREDGTFEMVLLNQMVPLSDGTTETINDLAAGKYDVVCDVGAAYKNRQQEAVEMFLRALEVDPALLQESGDIWLNNINAPGFDKIAERRRAIALGSGVIPPEQQTAEEQQAMQNQPQDDGPSADEMAMQIQMLQAQTAQLAQENVRDSNQIKLAELQTNIELAQQKAQSKLATDAAKLQQTQQRIDQEGQRVLVEKQRADFEQMLGIMKLQIDELSAQASALKNIKDAIGADVIVNKEAAKSYDTVASEINDKN